jgi:hypothetical protein
MARANSLGIAVCEQLAHLFASGYDVPSSAHAKVQGLSCREPDRGHLTGTSTKVGCRVGNWNANLRKSIRISGD